MPRNGSGTFSRTAGGFAGSSTWQNQRDTTSNIYASNHDEHDQDVADAITASLSKDGQTSPTANLPMGTYRHTGVGNPSARDQYATVAGIMDGTYVWGGTSTGSSNAYAIALPIDFGTLVAGCEVKFIANHNNTGAATLSCDGGPATNIRKSSSGSSSLANGDIMSGTIIHVVYDGSVWRLLSPRANSWLTYSPSFTPSGSMTFTGTSVQVADYLPSGSVVDVILNFQGTTGGTLSNSITATLPFVASDIGSGLAMQFSDYSNLGFFLPGKCHPVNATNTVKFMKYDEDNFPAGLIAFRSQFRFRT
jgi:hypothetical protein